MSANFSAHVPTTATAFTHGLSLRLSAYGKVAMRYFSHRSAIATLHELDDAALQDMGLARSEIEAAVHGLITRPHPTRM